MHKKGRLLINKAMNNKKIIKLDKKCEYLPCHEDLEDCTFCYCPFYPCNDHQTGGYTKFHSRTGESIWVCSSCIFPHKIENAKRILNELINLNSNFNLINREELLKIRLKILEDKGD